MNNLPIDKLKVSPLNVRANLDKGEDFQNLTDSIRQQGILEPLLVRPNSKGYEIVVGQRRFMAGTEAGLQEFPCIVKELNDEQVMELSLVENLQRKNLKPSEVCGGLWRLYEKVCNRCKNPHNFALEISQKIGMSKRNIENYLALKSLNRAVMEDLDNGLIDINSALKLKNLPESKTEELMEKVREVGGITRTEAEEVIETIKEEPEKEIEKIVEEKIQQRKIYLILPDDIYTRIQRYAEEKHEEPRILVLKIIREWLERRGEKL